MLTASGLGMPEIAHKAPIEKVAPVGKALPPVKVPPMVMGSPQPPPRNYASSIAETTLLQPLGNRDLRTMSSQEALPSGTYLGPAPIGIPSKPPPPVLLGNHSIVVPPTPPPVGRQPPPAPPRRESIAKGSAPRGGEIATSIPVYQTIAHLRENAERADGSRRPEQLVATPPGMAALCAVVGSARSSISKMGACLPYDNVHMIRGIFIRGLDFQLSD